LPGRRPRPVSTAGFPSPRFAAFRIHAYRLKLDGSPVTEADLATEKATIERLRQHRPNDGVSEESGTVAAGARRWLLDPIDGTVAFMARSDDWGTHVALETDGAVTLGMIARPTRRSRWWAVAGEGAFRYTGEAPTLRRDRLRVSATAKLGAAVVGVFGSESSQAPVLLEAAGARVQRNGSLITELPRRAPRRRRL
jgi:fructose-1,6-bisphosphatase/inositol monophosphatase family enzyme